MEAERHTALSHVWTALIVPPILLGGLIFGYIIFSGASSAEAQEIEGLVRAALPYIIAANHTLVLALLLYLLRKSGRGLADIGWGMQGVTTVVREIAIGLAIGVALYLFKEFAVDSVRALAESRTPTFNSLFNFGLERSEVPLLVVATTFIFVEESVYRGFAIPPLRRRFGLAGALGLSSLLFGFLHWGNGLFAIGATAVIGFLLAVVFLWRRNLVAGTAAHALYNLFVVLT